jgi:uncharacterized protein
MLRNFILFTFLPCLLMAKTNLPDSNFVSQEVKFFNFKDSIHLAGTLTIPKNSKNFPTVILITGSGNQDRDETILGHKPFKILSDYLSNRGIAVLRIDDRGVGQSTGKGNPISSSADFANDIEAAIDFLKFRKDINFKKIGLAGHSEGGMIGAMISARNKNVSFLISIAGPGCKMDEVMYKQNRAVLKSIKTDSMTIENYIAYFYKPMIDKLKTAQDSLEFNTAIQELIKNYRSKFKTEAVKTIGLAKDEFLAATYTKVLFTNWWRFSLNYDPKNDWQNIKIPVLAINGLNDVQVDAEMNLNCIEENLRMAGNKKYKILKLEKLNHLFQTSITGGTNEYAQIKTCFEEPLLIEIDKFLQQFR